MVADYPRLIEALAEHEGIGFVMTYSEVAGEPVVMGTGGFRGLATGRGQGEDPLARFSPHTARFLLRQSSYCNVGDIVINSLVDQRGHVAAFEELIGCHGGAGASRRSPCCCTQRPGPITPWRLSVPRGSTRSSASTLARRRTNGSETVDMGTP